MKLTFFLIALALIFLRLCYPTLELWHNGHGSGTMVMNGDHFIEEIKWSGKIRLSDDERSFAEISPGGYVKFQENDTTMKAKSDLQGEITYTLYNGKEQLSLNDSGQQFIATQIKKMVRFGFFAEGRAEHIYKKGGVRAVLAEISNIQMDGARDQYFDLLFQSDSLTPTDQIELLRQIGNSNNESGQQHLLSIFTRDHLRDSAVAQQWLIVVGHLGPSYMKKDLLFGYLGANTKVSSELPVDQFDSVLLIVGRFDAPNDQQEVYQRLSELRPLRMRDSVYAQPWLHGVGEIGPSYMKKDLLLGYLGADTNASAGLPVDQFDTVLSIAARFDAPNDQQEVLERMAGLPDTTDAEWASLLRAVGALDQDYIKSDLFTKIAPKLPRNDSLRAVYRKAAKSIQGDNDYGKTMRALE